MARRPMSAPALRYASAPDRRVQLLERVESEGYCTFSELAAALDVSEMTVRRDVQRHIDEGRLRGVQGGVSAFDRSTMLGRDFAARLRERQELKRAIAARAVTLVAPGATVALDAGTTTLEVANLLRLQPNGTVVTASLPAMMALLSGEGPTLIGLGGELHRLTQSFAGRAALDAIAEMRIDLLFLAASGLSDAGVFCANEFDAMVKRALIAVSERVVLVSDASKFIASAAIRTCELARLDVVVIDSSVTDLQRAALERHIAEVIIVAGDPDTLPATVTPPSSTTMPEESL